MSWFRCFPAKYGKVAANSPHNQDYTRDNKKPVSKDDLKTIARYFKKESDESTQSRKRVVKC